MVTEIVNVRLVGGPLDDGLISFRITRPEGSTMVPLDVQIWCGWSGDYTEIFWSDVKRGLCLHLYKLREKQPILEYAKGVGVATYDYAADWK